MRKSSLLVLFIFTYPLITQATVPILVPTPPPVSAPIYLLQDFHSGNLLMAKDIDERLQPASLTKLMTAYLIFQKLQARKIHLIDRVRISEKAWRMLGSRMYLEVNTQVAVEDLLKGMIIQSGNDASIALAEFVAGTEEAFVTLMNEQARQLELSNTHYTNSTGLPDDQQHYTTVRDLAKLTKALIQNFADYYRWYSQQEFTYNDITQYNRNRLLWQDYTVDGVKTGFTDMAGYCLIASAKRGNMRLIAIVMGTKSEKNRLQDSEKMLDYGFRFFETFPLYEQMQPIDVERIWYGTADQVPLGLMETLYVTIPKGYYKQLQATIHIDKHIMAPVVAGKVYGTLNINLGNQVIAEQPLTALTSVEIGHLGKRLLDSLWLLFY